MSYFAHSHPDPDQPWEPLFTPFGEEESACVGFPNCEKCREMVPQHGHLNKVAWWTAKFMQDMFPEGSEDAKTAAEWGYLAGLWHDLGKFAPEWQEYLKKKVDSHIDEVVGKVDHSTAGAKLAVSKSPLGHLIATAIAGHHAGLLDARNIGACLEKRLGKKECVIPIATSDVLEKSVPKPLSFLNIRPNDFPCAFFQRMLFSSLVDADFLATEAFMDEKRGGPGLLSPAKCFQQALNLLEIKIGRFGIPKTQVNKARERVLKDCLEKANEPSGFFSLTVPTGGGKTLSSLAFALKHAIKNGQKRIIYVIPFTSIIEQNAKVFKELLSDLGDGIVLEHHSNLSPENETAQSRLASENWDAPVVVSTAVQFYESLFASKTSDSRKLHNIANSVIILDEAQAIPVQYLTPCLRALEQLTENYHVSTVLCTATQPAIELTDDFQIGLKGITKIISDTDRLFAALHRVEVKYRGKLVDQTVATEIEQSQQALCIVNTRKHAQTLFRLLPENDENYHLSTLMCPAHRLKVLETVKCRLDQNHPVRLISTQLIEAGVDIDFPMVYRSIAGLDSIAQAAGRCNRNGEIPTGNTFVFQSEHIAAEAFFRETANVGHEILDLHVDDPLSTAAIRAYFNKYYYQQKGRWDSKGIMERFKCVPTNLDLPLLFQYRTAASDFKLIESEQISVIIPWDDKSKGLIEKQLRVETVPVNRRLLRNLQPYSVQIYEHQFRQNIHQFESIRDGSFHVLICPETHYSNRCGLSLDEHQDNSKTLIF